MLAADLKLNLFLPFENSLMPFKVMIGLLSIKPVDVISLANWTLYVLARLMPASTGNGDHGFVFSVPKRNTLSSDCSIS